ncbi:hypothetical protein CTRI78_v008882 [Colletotrichum trifolii]|uniref:Uncharacterized protein n=1 Tax=Colletotrichum trifolii TaxID=5466 RepID=A0A4R8QSA6_COLTR|nr:hypothetical protein CTRI78_v008882 [Colletotrichum trifolii]
MSVAQRTDDCQVSTGMEDDGNTFSPVNIETGNDHAGGDDTPRSPDPAESSSSDNSAEQVGISIVEQADPEEADLGVPLSDPGEGSSDYYYRHALSPPRDNIWDVDEDDDYKFYLMDNHAVIPSPTPAPPAAEATAQLEEENTDTSDENTISELQANIALCSGALITDVPPERPPFQDEEFWAEDGAEDEDDYVLPNTAEAETDLRKWVLKKNTKAAWQRERQRQQEEETRRLEQKLARLTRANERFRERRHRRTEQESARLVRQREIDTRKEERGVVPWRPFLYTIFEEEDGEDVDFEDL